MTNIMDQNWAENNQILFVNGVQVTGNMCNMGYAPMSYYPQMYPIMGSTGVESVSYNMNGNGYPVYGPIMFYL
jgi:hypothetical protein